MFHGAITALVTPFKNGRLDLKTYRALIERQIKGGIDGIVPCGTTGESATLSHDEHKKVVDVCVKAVRGRVPVIAGAGSNSTAEAVDLARAAKKSGADATLQVTPYYNKPTQDGLYRHFKTIADTVNLPIVLYNVPGRTASNILPATVARLARHKNIVAIKEASGDLAQIAEVKRLCGNRISILSGDDALLLPILSIGGTGIISVVSNLVPGEIADICRLWREGDITKARKRFLAVLPLARAMFIESNPIPAKTALGMMGIASAEMRLPLTPMSRENRAKLKPVLKKFKLIR